MTSDEIAALRAHIGDDPAGWTWLDEQTLKALAEIERLHSLLAAWTQASDDEDHQRLTAETGKALGWEPYRTYPNWPDKRECVPSPPPES